MLYLITAQNIIIEGQYKFMCHGGCCNCFICKLGKSLGLMEGCKKGDSCCQAAPKKAVKKKLSAAKSGNGRTKKSKSKKK